MLMVVLAAKNNALRMTLAVKERVTTTIPRPEKGVASKGFNLQEAMGLADDGETYSLLRVSPTNVRTYLSLMIVRDLSAKAGLDCAVVWHRQPKELISKIIGAICVFSFHFVLHIFLKCYSLGMTASQLFQEVPTWLARRRIPQIKSQEQMR